MAADDDEIRQLAAADAAGPRHGVPGRQASWCWPMAMNPSAWLKAVTAPEPLAMG